MTSPLSGFVNPLGPPPTNTGVPVVTDKGIQIGTARFVQVPGWVQWLNLLRTLQTQVRISAGIVFPPVLPHDRVSVTGNFDLGNGHSVPADSWLVMRGPLDPITDAPITTPPSTFVEVQMSAVNQTRYTLHNYGTGLITPTQMNFDALVILRQ